MLTLFIKNDTLKRSIDNMNNILIFVMFMNVFGFGLKTERNPKCLTISDLSLFDKKVSLILTNFHHTVGGTFPILIRVKGSGIQLHQKIGINFRPSSISSAPEKVKIKIAIVSNTTNPIATDFQL